MQVIALILSAHPKSAIVAWFYTLVTELGFTLATSVVCAELQWRVACFAQHAFLDCAACATTIVTHHTCALCAESQNIRCEVAHLAAFIIWFLFGLVFCFGR